MGFGLDMKWAGVATSFGPTIYIYIYIFNIKYIINSLITLIFKKNKKSLITLASVD